MAVYDRFFAEAGGRSGVYGVTAKARIPQTGMFGDIDHPGLKPLDDRSH